MPLFLGKKINWGWKSQLRKDYKSRHVELVLTNIYAQNWHVGGQECTRISVDKNEKRFLVQLVEYIKACNNFGIIIIQSEKV